jgi:hypothetical protein
VKQGGLAMQIFARTACLWTGLFLLNSGRLSADNEIPSFTVGDTKATAADIQRIDVSYTADFLNNSVVAQAVVTFTVTEQSFPLLDMIDNPTRIELNGELLDLSSFALVSSPDFETKMRVVKQSLEAGSVNKLVLDYRPSEGVSMGRVNGVSVLYTMDDLQMGGRGFFEQYGPAGFENDSYSSSIRFKVVNYGDISTDYRVIANGNAQQIEDMHWLVEFPDYFNTSSFYLHIFRGDRFTVLTENFAGMSANIPVIVYGSSPSLVRSGLDTTLAVLAENESVYGPYSHPSAIAYMTETDGGMEHCGATITSLWALEHEFTHSWFARGVMPANGNAGWIDEAVASWRDNEYPRNAGPSGIAVNLGGYSPYKRNTTRLAYSKGATLISNFDSMFRTTQFEGQAGMKGILRALYSEKRLNTISVDYFKQLLEGMTGTDLTAIFKKYVFGRSDSLTGLDLENRLVRTIEIPEISSHPRKFTKEERLSLF